MNEYSHPYFEQLEVSPNFEYASAIVERNAAELRWRNEILARHLPLVDATPRREERKLDAYITTAVINTLDGQPTDFDLVAAAASWNTDGDREASFTPLESARTLAEDVFLSAAKRSEEIQHDPERMEWYQKKRTAATTVAKRHKIGPNQVIEREGTYEAYIREAYTPTAYAEELLDPFAWFSRSQAAVYWVQNQVHRNHFSSQEAEAFRNEIFEQIERLDGQTIRDIRRVTDTHHEAGAHFAIESIERFWGYPGIKDLRQHISRVALPSSLQYHLHDASVMTYF